MIYVDIVCLFCCVCFVVIVVVVAFVDFVRRVILADSMRQESSCTKQKNHLTSTSSIHSSQPAAMAWLIDIVTKAQAITLRAVGLTYTAISEQTGISIPHIYKPYKQALNRE